MVGQIGEYLKEFELSINIPLGLKEVLKSAPHQVKIPSELLSWMRQSYIEGRRSGIDMYTVESIVRTVAIKTFYSPLQV